MFTEASEGQSRVNIQMCHYAPVGYTVVSRHQSATRWSAGTSHGGQPAPVGYTVVSWHQSATRWSAGTSRLHGGQAAPVGYTVVSWHQSATRWSAGTSRLHGGQLAPVGYTVVSRHQSATRWSRIFSLSFFSSVLIELCHIAVIMRSELIVLVIPKSLLYVFVVTRSNIASYHAVFQILLRYDLVLVQEIRDSSQTAFPELVSKLNRWVNQNNPTNLMSLYQHCIIYPAAAASQIIIRR